MEAIAVFGLVGLGYLINKLSDSKDEGFRNSSAEELETKYTGPFGEMYPSEPVPGPQGDAIAYGRIVPPVAPRLQAVQSSTAQVRLNPGNVEENPKYLTEDSILSSLSGNQISADNFTHNNMVPFFGSRIRQNVDSQTNTGILDSYTGAGATQIKKQEVETMFATSQTPYGNPFGLENSTEFLEGRIELPRNRGGEKPFESVRVGAGVGEKFGSTGKGGFQQLEVNQLMMSKMPKTDDLRTENNPKLSYKAQVIPGQHFIGDSAHEPGEMRKNKPDTFFIDQTGERFIGAFSTEGQKQTSRPIQVMKYQSRPETSSELIGPAVSQEYGESYVTGSYRTPMAQQYGGAGYRNANMTEYFTNDVDSPEADYGRSSIEIRPNERAATSSRTMALNVVPAESGNLSLRYTDDLRPTYRAETVGNIRQTGTPVGYASGAPALTVWADDVARTTVKETTIHWNYLGSAASADAPNKLKVYDPSDIARRTQKEGITANSEYYGTLSYADAPSKQKVYDPNDIARRTQKEGISAKSEYYGTPSSADAPSKQKVYDPSDIARRTQKEGISAKSEYYGMPSSADAPYKQKVYDPNDIAKPTQKSQISEKSEYYGTPTSSKQDFTSHDAAYNMRTNPVKEAVSKGRDPMSGNGGLAIFKGDVQNQTYKRIDADSINDRANAVNRSVEVPAGAGDIGEVRYRAPLKLDVSSERNQYSVISSLEENPLMKTQSIHKNAEIDENAYRNFLKNM